MQAWKGSVRTSGRSTRKKGPEKNAVGYKGLIFIEIDGCPLCTWSGHGLETPGPAHFPIPHINMPGHNVQEISTAPVENRSLIAPSKLLSIFQHLCFRCAQRPGRRTWASFPDVATAPNPDSHQRSRPCWEEVERNLILGCFWAECFFSSAS